MSKRVELYVVTLPANISWYTVRMKVKVISYSLTGNNEALAASIAAELSAEHLKLIEPKSRNTLSIVLDVLFDRTPSVSPTTGKEENDDLVLFVGPVWLGKVATPFRAYFDNFKSAPCTYAFISISGGANGPNPDLASELKKRTGKEPVEVINLYIADLLPPVPKPTIKVTSAYHLNAGEVKRLTKTVVKTLQKHIP